VSKIDNFSDTAGGESFKEIHVQINKGGSDTPIRVDPQNESEERTIEAVEEPSPNQSADGT
jgi:hypothetical protein